MKVQYVNVQVVVLKIRSYDGQSCKQKHIAKVCSLGYDTNYSFIFVEEGKVLRFSVILRLKRGLHFY